MCEISPLWFLNAFSNCLFEDMQSHITCMCGIYPNVILHMSSKIACLNKISPSWFLNTLWNCLIEDMQSHISCICVIFSEVCFHMCSQTCLNRCKVIFVACVRFTQMLYYTSPLKSPAWTVTIVADVRNFSIMISKCLFKSPDWRYAKSH